jgi:hypothetical protein
VREREREREREVDIDKKCFTCVPGRLELPFLEIGKTMGEAGIRSLLFCL